MEVTFSLKDAEIFLPSGRVMNLKDKLGWSDIKCQASEIEDAVSSIISNSFELDVNYTDKIEKSVLKGLTNNSDMIKRQESYLNKAIVQIDKSPSVLADLKHLVSEVTTTLPELTASMIGNNSVQQKLEKLKTLRQINNK